MAAVIFYPAEKNLRRKPKKAGQSQIICDPFL